MALPINISAMQKNINETISSDDLKIITLSFPVIPNKLKQQSKIKTA